jgi:serine protease Do
MRRSVILITLLTIACSSSAWAWRPVVDPNNLRDTITVQIVRHCRPAIVSITAHRLIRQEVNPFGSMFPLPMGMGTVVQEPADFLGSGFIIQKDGYIVTNNHVVDQARSIHVKLADGRKLAATVVDSDPSADLAILKITKPGIYPTLQLGSSKGLMIGEPTIAVGNPFGYSQSVSSGIVSATGRTIHEPDNPHPLKNLIQTDAAINPGNSGGPLLDAYGRVIGINTAIRGNAQEIGFAIGIDRLKELIPTLMNPAVVDGRNVGVKFGLVAGREGVAGPHEHVVVAGTMGPWVTRVNGNPIHTLQGAFAALLAMSPAQQTVAVKFANGTPRTYPVTRVPPSPIVLKTRKLLGMVVKELTPAMAGRMKLNVNSGLLVTQIFRHSIADKAGIEPGDVIIQIGPYRVRNLAFLGRLLPAIAKARRVEVLVLRNGRVGAGYLQIHGG